MQLRFREYIDTESGILKVEFKSSLCTQISTSWWLGKNWNSKSQVLEQFMHQDFTQRWLEFKSGVKVKLKWSFEVKFWNPSFHPDLLKTGIQKVEFKSSLFTQISPSWWLEFKSGVKVEFKNSFEMEFRTTSYHLVV